MHYLFYKVRTEEICLLKQIVEAYENMMVLSTIDESIPKIQITVAPDFLPDCEKILSDLGKRFLMIPLPEPPTISQGNY